MSKKPKGRKRTQLAAAAEVPSTAPVAAEAISKTQKRKLQKKRAKFVAREEHEVAAKAHAEAKAAKAARAAAAQLPASEPHPPPPPLAFEADEDDHCESPPEAYGDVAPLLALIAEHLGKEPATLRIYDPYFCNGAVARHLGARGFPCVHNANEDFYAVDAAGAVPEHDVVLTNPPYSADHPQRLLSFLGRNGKPWLCLMPNWVQARPYYAAAAAAASGGARLPFYIVPRKRYNYWTPKGRRADVAAGGSKAKTHGHTNAALGVRTSPFVSFWYCGHMPQAVRKRLKEARRAERHETSQLLQHDEQAEAHEGQTVAIAGAEASEAGAFAATPRTRVCWDAADLPASVLDR